MVSLMVFGWGPGLGGILATRFSATIERVRPRQSPFSRLTLLAKVMLVVNSVLIVAVTATGLSTYRVARDALREEVFTSGRLAVSDFARSNALEFLDPEKGPIELQLRLGQLISDEGPSRLVAAYALDRAGEVISHSGQSIVLPTREILSLASDEVVHSSDRAIIVATPVTYDEVVLGHIAFAFDGAMISEAGTTILIQVLVVIVAFILLNLLGLWLVIRGLLKPVEQLGQAAEALAGGDYEHPLPTNLSQDEIGRAARSFENMRDALTVHMRFSNAALVNRIREGRVVDEGDEHQLSVVFGDAVGYTAWSQNLPPRVIFSTLSRYYTCIGRIMVGRCGGIIDKFIGDGVMIHFGLMGGDGPAQPTDAVALEHVRSALRGVIYSQIGLRALAYAIERFENRPSLLYRFGMASGRCLVGPFGARDIMLDYTLIGNVVNLAARLEYLAPPGGLLIDRFTRLDSGEHFLQVEDGGIQRVKGSEIPVQVFHALDFAHAEEHERMRAYLLDELMDDEFIASVILGGNDDPAKIEEIRSFLEREVRKRPPLSRPG